MAIAKWLQNQDNPKNRRKRSVSQERKLAKKLNQPTSSSRVQAGSGSLWGEKGDVKDRFSLFECKRTDRSRNGFKIQQEWLNKIKLEAIKEGKIPALHIQVGNKSYLLIEECYL